MVFLFLTGVSSVFSQEDRTIEVAIYWWPVGDGLHVEGAEQDTPVWPTLFYQSGNRSIPVQVDPGSRTPFFKYSGSQAFQLFEETTDPEGIVGKTPRLTTPLPTATGRVLLIVIPSESEAYKVYPINISVASMPQDSVQVVNMGQEALAAKISKKQVVLAPGEPQILKFTKSELEDRSLKCAVREADTWRMVYSSSLNVRPGQRSILIFYPQGRGWQKMLLDGI